MPRLLVLIAAVAACGALASGLPSALLAADPEAAHALARLTEAADAGDLYALEDLAESRRRGHLRVPDPRGRTQAHLPIWSAPGQAWLAQRRFERVLRDSVAAGHPNALHLAADRLLSPWRTGRADPTQADRDTAAVLFQRLADRGPSTLGLAFLAKRLQREADYERILAEAAAHEPHACTFHLALTHRTVPEAGVPLSEHAAFLDASARCADLFEAQGLDEVDPGRAFVAGLVAQAASGNAEAAALLDGLRAEGVFARHPRLGALLAPEAE